MKALWFVSMLLVIFISWPASATCFHKIYGDAELDRRTLSIPTTVIAKVIQKKIPVPGLPLIAPDIEVTLTFNAKMEFRLDCSCRPCCCDPQEQVASLTVSASVRALGGTVHFAAVDSKKCGGEQDPAPGKMCECPVTVGYEPAATVPAIGVNLSLGGFTLKTEEVKMKFSATPHCGCTDDPKCFGNTAPSIVAVSPTYLDLNKGHSAEITVEAIDREGNLAIFPEEITGPGYLPTTLVTAWYSEDRAVGRAVYRVEFPKEGEKLSSFAPIRAEDACGQGDGKNIPVRLFYPPVLIPIPEGGGWGGWGDRHYLQMFMVNDPDFGGCNRDRWEAITVTANATCGEVYPVERTVSCWCVHEECRTGGVTFIPKKDCCERSFTIVATDLRGQTGTLPVIVPNRPPYLEKTAEIRVRPGRTQDVHLNARDPDGDTVRIEQTSGPGALRGNKWSWTVPDPYWGPSVRLVGFRLTDKCGAQSHGYFSVRVLQPPRVYGASVWLRQCGTAPATGTASLYVFDPDTPPEGLTFFFPTFVGLGVTLVAVEKPPYYYGSYYGYTARVQVSADTRLCPGAYPVQFTMTDPDGNSASATLTVYVRGNQAPRAQGELSGGAAVALTPGGVKGRVGRATAAGTAPPAG